VQITLLDLAADEQLAGRLLHLQRTAYALEAALIGDDRIPPLHETLDDLRSAPLRWAGAFDDNGLMGAVAWEETAEEVDIARLVVSPDRHRRGVGTALVREVLTLSRGRRTIVSTGRDNASARQLYERLGFVKVGDEEALPGLWVTRYTMGAHATG
jgi:ribosomal protein S18 acetylase RimI-like enzyme